MRRAAKGLIVLGVLLLAGCAQAPAPAPPPRPQPPLVAHDVLVSATVYVADAIVCPPNVSCISSGPVDLVMLKDNQTMTRYDLAGELNGAFGAAPPRPVHVELDCTGAPLCSKPLAQANGLGPFHFKGELSLPPLAVLTMHAYDLNATPDPIGFLESYIEVSGSISVLAKPGPPLKLVKEELHLTGMTGPCVLLAECNSGPGFFRSIPFEGAIQKVRLNLTWTAQTDLTRELRLTISCSGQGCPASSSSAHTGTSPLRAARDSMEFPSGARLYLGVYEIDPTGAQIGLAKARQPFRLDGAVYLLKDPNPQ